MYNYKGIVYPRIAEEVVNYEELQRVWDCSYCTAYRIMYGYSYPNHIRKRALSEYLGIPVDVLFTKVDPKANEATTPKNSGIISESSEEV